LAFAYEVWQAAEQRKPTAHLPHPAAPMPTATPTHVLTLRSANMGFKTLAQISEHFNHGSVRGNYKF
jgi:hypothetical protein